MFYSSNEHKIEEAGKILVPLGIDLIPYLQTGISIIPPEETGKTFQKNAEIKATAAYRACGIPTIAEDSGIKIDALGGAPGVYSKRYAGEHCSSTECVKKVLEKLENVPKEKRTARFVCVVCLVLSKNTKIFTRGTCEGTIALEPKGSFGFAYDVIFLTKFNKTFAEISQSTKNQISHRGIALKKLGEKICAFNCGDLDKCW